MRCALGCFGGAGSSALTHVICKGEKKEYPGLEVTKRNQTGGLMRKHTIELSEAQRQELESLVRSGKAPARTIQHAQILLKSAPDPQGEGWSDKQM